MHSFWTAKISPGPKTAAKAGIIAWVFAGSLNILLTDFSGLSVVVVALVWVLVEMTVAGLLVDRLYREA